MLKKLLINVDTNKVLDKDFNGVCDYYNCAVFPYNVKDNDEKVHVRLRKPKTLLSILGFETEVYVNNILVGKY